MKEHRRNLQRDNSIYIGALRRGRKLEEKKSRTYDGIPSSLLSLCALRKAGPITDSRKDGRKRRKKPGGKRNERESSINYQLGGNWSSEGTRRKNSKSWQISGRQHTVCGTREWEYDGKASPWRDLPRGLKGLVRKEPSKSVLSADSVRRNASGQHETNTSRRSRKKEEKSIFK